MTARGPMVLAPEGPVPPNQHPFVQEQMLILKCIKTVSAVSARASTCACACACACAYKCVHVCKHI